jgi:hypothetical protein
MLNAEVKDEAGKCEWNEEVANVERGSRSNLIGPCCFLGLRENSDELAGFREEGSLSTAAHQVGSLADFQPKGGFVGFLDDSAKLSDEVGSRLASAGGSIVRRHSRSRPQKLPAHMPSLRCVWQQRAKPKYSQREPHGSLFEITLFAHASAICRPRTRVATMRLNRKTGWLLGGSDSFCAVIRASRTQILLPSPVMVKFEFYR